MQCVSCLAMQLLGSQGLVDVECVTFVTVDVVT
jgi:hypothetical protein